jgi:hypothetical protein
LVYLSVLLYPNSYIILFWEFYFLPFSVCPNQGNLFNLIVSLFLHILMKSGWWASDEATTFFVLWNYSVMESIHYSQPWRYYYLPQCQ